jgi:alpha-beta hydrolase superfamily lysophospholipase
MKKLFKWLGVLLLVYIAGGVILFFIQDKILFYPAKLHKDFVFQFSQPYNEINIPVTDEKNLNIIRFTVPDSVCKGVVLYFHGNRENVTRYAPFARYFTSKNYEVWIPDYPGFGKSTGPRNEKVLYEDAYRLYRLARNKFSADSIVIYGKSIGTGIAAQLASVRDCKRLILETPYYSMDELAGHYFFMYPVSSLTKYEFPINQYLEKVQTPVTIFHGTKDEVIPYKQAAKLMKIINQKGELVTILKGKHNNLTESELYQKKLDSLLQQ